ncbi:hypothetical protein ACFVRR_06245 [Gottfriedia sp. NPDC057948]|uniref:hypothetical protein n=1 Tax=Gottfriedia sp. NPDC057948 TaxID=3346287 RepID=UPI0036DEF5A7
MIKKLIVAEDTPTNKENVNLKVLLHHLRFSVKAAPSIELALYQVRRRSTGYS